MKLPGNWKDFKIVQTREGVFTGQIRVDGILPIDWNKNGIKTLQEYTKKYLEEKLGYEIKTSDQ